MFLPRSAVWPVLMAPTLVLGMPSRIRKREHAHGRDGRSAGTSKVVIAVGVIVGLVVLCLVLAVAWRWRKLTARRRRDVRARGFDTVKTSMSQHSDVFASPSLGHTHKDAVVVDILPYPPPALAPSNDTLRRGNSLRRNMVRESILGETHKRRLPNPTEQSFFIEDDTPESPVSPASRRLQTRGGSLLNVVTHGKEQAGFDFKPPPIPDSPEAMRSHFSWTTKSDTRSVRSSVSEPARFRSVDSWVSHQASRCEAQEPKKKLFVHTDVTGPKRSGTATSSAPQTPAAFRHHPGHPVSFLKQHQRLESADIDCQILSP